MHTGEIARRSLDNSQFFRFRQATEKISAALDRRLDGHLEVLRPLFTPRHLLGAFIKSAVPEEVQHSEKAYARLSELYGEVYGFFALPRNLQPPLPPLSNLLEASPLQYRFGLKEAEGKIVTVSSPVSRVLSYRGQSPLSRLRGMLSAAEPRQEEEMRQTLINHLIPVVFLERHPGLAQLLADLRYQVVNARLEDFGGLPVVILKAPLETFLPPDDFIREVTGLSGIAAFQEIIDPEAFDRIPDPFAELVKQVAQ